MPCRIPASSLVTIGLGASFLFPVLFPASTDDEMRFPSACHSPPWPMQATLHAVSATSQAAVEPVLTCFLDIELKLKVVSFPKIPNTN